MHAQFTTLCVPSFVASPLPAASTLAIMDRIYCSEQIEVPPALPAILKSYTKEVIRYNPKDIPAFSRESVATPPAAAGSEQRSGRSAYAHRCSREADADGVVSLLCVHVFVQLLRRSREGRR
jgi:hypothetical protein